MADDAAYDVTTTVAGKTVRYACGHCGCRLTNPLSRAGHEDFCPDCHTPHVVPGIREQQAESERRVSVERGREAARTQRQAESREAVVNRVAAKSKRESRLTLERDPFREWSLYAVVSTIIITLVGGKHVASAVASDASGMTLVILGLFAVGLVLNVRGVRQLRNEYVCAAVCLGTLKQSSGIKELIELPAAGVFHQHIKDLASIAKYDRGVSQEGLVSLLYSKLIARSRMVEVLSGVLVTLGLIGTVIGLISMTNGLSGTLEALDDSGDASSMLSGVRATMRGLGTAFYTTLAGAFLGSVALRLLNNVYTSNVEHLVAYIARTTEVRILPLLKMARRR